MNTTIAESTQMSVIVCPTRFARELLFFGGTKAKPGRRRAGHICMRCLHGEHELCQYGERCPCIHQLLRAEAELVRAQLLDPTFDSSRSAELHAFLEELSK